MFGYTGSVTASYVTDGIGQRVERTVNGTTYDYAFDNQGHENVKGTAGFAGWTWSELYLGGMHVNTYINSSTYFSHDDHLGTTRTVTDPNGNTNSSYFKNRPFGEWSDYGSETSLLFTGDFLDDPDSDTFHTPNRQYSQINGRWMVPDPAGLAAVNPANPQTWNRYAYVGNNPLSFVDPSGLLDSPIMCPMPIGGQCGGGGIDAGSAGPADNGGGFDDGGDGSTGDPIGCPNPNDPICQRPPGNQPAGCIFIGPDGGWDCSNYANSPQHNAEVYCFFPGFCDGGEIGHGSRAAANNGQQQQPQQTPQQTPQQPKKQPWYCGTGNSWSHPFTAPTGRQWGQWSVVDGATAYVLNKYVPGNPVSDVLTVAAFVEG